jgi:hypothetical protein
LSIVEKGCTCFAFEIEGMKAKKVKIKNIIIFLVLMIMLLRVRLGVCIYGDWQYSIVALYRDIDEVVTVQLDGSKQNELQFILF